MAVDCTRSPDLHAWTQGSSVPRLQSLALASVVGLRHAFFGRRGGVGAGVYRSLNCGLGTGDDPAHVRENRRRAVRALTSPAQATPQLVTCRQEHGRGCVAIADDTDVADLPPADAIVTRRAGVAIGVLTADCVPVLLADPSARVIACAHAGWRGLVSGVLEAVVCGMRELGARPRNSIAVLGPAISQTFYEVQRDFFENLTQGDSSRRRFFSAFVGVGGNGVRWFFDLHGYAMQCLSVLDIGRIDRVAHDTFGSPDFFSRRRDCRAVSSGSGVCVEPSSSGGPAAYGRNLSAICLDRDF